jgi:hypothetical protein
MSEPRRALVLHLSSGSDPLLIAVAAEAADALTAGLPDLIRRGVVETVTAANGTDFAINFGQVLAAHVDVVSGLGQLYGSPVRERHGAL